jgi:hypothetical protein
MMYLGFWMKAFAVASTLNYAGLGLLFDICYMPWYVAQANAEASQDPTQPALPAQPTDAAASERVVASVPATTEFFRVFSIRYAVQAVQQLILASCYGAAVQRIIFGVLDVEKIIEIDDDTTRSLCYAIIAATTCVGVMVGLKCTPGYGAKWWIAYIVSIIAVGLLDRPARARAQIFDPVSFSAIVHAIVIAITRYQVQPAKQVELGPAAGPGKCRKCVGFSMKLLLFSVAQACVWTVYTASVLLNIQVPAGAVKGLDMESNGMESRPLGILLWHNRQLIWRHSNLLFAGLRFVSQKRGSVGSLLDFADPYQELGLSKNAPFSDVKNAHRALALELHPDRTPEGLSDEEKADRVAKFDKMQRAYERISRQNARSEQRKRRTNAAPPTYQPPPPRRKVVYTKRQKAEKSEFVE